MQRVQSNYDRLGFVVVVEATQEASRELSRAIAEETRFTLSAV